MTIIDAINDTARALTNLSKVMVEVANQTEVVSVTEALDVEAKKEEAKEPKKLKQKQLFDPTPKKQEEVVTVEMVRSVLAEKSQAGHTDKVKTLLDSFGAAKLSAVKPEDYAKLMAAAKEIN